MFTIVALGNPGEEYRNTRHNVAWIVLDAILESHAFPNKIASSKHVGEIAEGLLYSEEVLAVFPHTYMNKSGSAVKKCIELGSEIEKLIVIADEVDLPFGDIKISYDSGSSGHNGVQSVIDVLGTKAFTRIRIGIGKKTLFGILRRPKGDALSKFVLGEFSKNELETLKKITKKVESGIELIVTKGIEKAMSEIN